MEKDFWRDRWRQGRIGFHQPKSNAFLERFFRRLELPDRRARVFVPLCGKSRDMSFLAAQGFEVVGNELVEAALVAFYEEQEIPYTRTEAGGFTIFEGGGVRTFAGDFFALDPSLVGPIDAVYDRAAIVALPAEMRRRYAAHVASLLSPGGRILQICFEYAQHEMAGPPFSVPPEEIEALYGGSCKIEQLGAEEVLAARPEFRDRGLSSIREWACLLTKR